MTFSNQNKQTWSWFGAAVLALSLKGLITQDLVLAQEEPQEPSEAQSLEGQEEPQVQTPVTEEEPGDDQSQDLATSDLPEVQEPADVLGLSIQEPGNEDFGYETYEVNLSQTQVRLDAMAALEQLRGELYDRSAQAIADGKALSVDDDVIFHGKSLAQVVHEAGLDRDTYTTNFDWSDELEKVAIYRAFETAEHARIGHYRIDDSLGSTFDVKSEQPRFGEVLSWGRDIRRSIFEGWGYFELDALNHLNGANGVWNDPKQGGRPIPSGHLIAMIDPGVLSYGFGYVPTSKTPYGPVTAGMMSSQRPLDPDKTQGTGLDGIYGLKVQVPSRLLTSQKREFTQEELIPYQTQEIKDDQIPAGQEILTPGIPGLRRVTYEEVTQDDRIISRKILDNQVIKAPEQAVLRLGTGQVEQEIIEETRPVAFQSQIIEDPDLLIGQEVTLQEGQIGLEQRTLTYLTFKGQRLGDPEVSPWKLIQAPVQKIVHQGTKAASIEDIATSNKEVIPATPIEDIAKPNKEAVPATPIEDIAKPNKEVVPATPIEDIAKPNKEVVPATPIEDIATLNKEAVPATPIEDIATPNKEVVPATPIEDIAAPNKEVIPATPIEDIATPNKDVIPATPIEDIAKPNKEVVPATPIEDIATPNKEVLPATPIEDIATPNKEVVPATPIEDIASFNKGNVQSTSKEESIFISQNHSQSANQELSQDSETLNKSLHASASLSSQKETAVEQDAKPSSSTLVNSPAESNEAPISQAKSSTLPATGEKDPWILLGMVASLLTTGLSLLQNKKERMES